VNRVLLLRVLEEAEAGGETRNPVSSSNIGARPSTTDQPSCLAHKTLHGTRIR
jgi:hypothetical protein